MVCKFTFSTDSRSTLSTGLSAARDNVGGMADSGTAGYVGGGSDSSTAATVDRFSFSNDARSTLSSGLSVARRWVCGVANESSLA